GPGTLAFFFLRTLARRFLDSPLMFADHSSHHERAEAARGTMSSLGALVSRDGTPLCAADLAPLEAALSRCPADGHGSWIEGPVGLTHAHFWTTPEDVGEVQPVFRAGGLLALAADVRLDDRA
ncbi:MAG TPA: hypothetical protein DD490_28070, partial [Acidobacteria bacterium]|nr:hypothetical protein [Acidobacteriota bacterium]